MNFLCKFLIWSCLRCLLATRVHKKLNWEAAYEIRVGEWQDTPPEIFLCVVL